MSNIKSNFVYQAGFQIMSMILPLVTSPILSRALGPEGVGRYAYMTSIVSYFVLLANLGIEKYGLREIAAVRDNKESLNRTFWEIWKLHVILCRIIGVCYIVFALFHSDDSLYFIILFAVYIGGVININWLFLGLEDFKKLNIRNMIVKLVIFVMVVLFVRSKNALLIYIIIESIGSLISNLIYWIMYREYIDKTIISYKQMYRHIKPLLILFIPVLLESLYVNMDRVMLGIMHVKSEVGYYDNANKALISKTIIYSITLVLMPRMSHLLKKKEYDTFHRLMNQSTGIILLLASAFSFGTAAVAKEFSVVFWGRDFAQCTNLIIIMAMAMPAMVLSREIREQYLIPSGKDRDYLISAAMGTISNLIINLILIPQHGAVGAAIATLLSEYIVLITQVIVVRRELPVVHYIHGNEMYFVFGILMLCVVRMVAMMLGVQLYTLLVEIILGIIVYFVLCIIYWKVTNQKYYYNLIKSLVSKQRKSKDQ